MDVWERSYDSRRILGAVDCAERVRYIRENPVRAHIATQADDYPFSSVGRAHLVDPAPGHLSQG
jgi:putative transposase